MMEGKATMEILTQVRHTRQILGNFRVGQGGKSQLKMEVDLRALVLHHVFPWLALQDPVLALEELPEDGLKAAAYCWAMMVG